MDEQNKGCGPTSLDPQDWEGLRQQGHRMLDDMLDYLQNIRQRPVWQPAPEQVRERFSAALPVEETDLAAVHQRFLDDVLPYAVGNAHPGFMGWVHGGGSPVGMLAEMLAAGLNANLGGRNQIPVEVERQVARWMRELFGFPASASGVFVTGTSMATLIAVWVARTRLAGDLVREQGLPAGSKQWTVYASRATHGSLAHALDLAGMGTDSWRAVPVDAQQRIDVLALKDLLDKDLADGFQPFMLIGNAGTVDAGAMDPLDTLADVASRYGMWFHVDGALGALGMMSPAIAPRLAGIERADSLAFDFHKWGQVPYDAGFALIRDGALHQRTFVSRAAYLRREQDGLAGGSPWPCDFGPDLSRGFRALKAWFTVQTYGTQRLGQMMAHTCEVAAWLGQQVASHPELELLVPVSLNIVCFRYRSSDAVNAAIAVAVQNSGLAAPSTTMIQGKLAIRAAVVNHRTCRVDVDVLLQAVLRFGRQIGQKEVEHEPDGN